MASTLPPPMPSTMPPPGTGLGASGAFALSGAYPASQNPVSRALRMLKTQLNLAVGQREEDPERAWLELVSVRERLEGVVDGAREDPLLLADVERFRGKLEEQIRKLTRDVGDEVVAPLYSWVDLLRQRSKLEAEVDNARARVAEARASRGARGMPPLATDEEAGAALDAAEKDLAWWRGEVPAPPSPETLAVWTDLGGDALRPRLPGEPQVVRSRATAASALIESAQGRALGASSYGGSKLELLLLPTIGATALLASMFALAGAHGRAAFGVFSAGGWSAFAVAIAVSAFTRRRASKERRAAIDVVWHHTLFTEQTSSLDLEVGWLRALTAALRARGAFDGHKGEGGQLAELAKWRPDLEPVVAEVAKSSIAPPS
jgi:hypothetical protein